MKINYRQLSILVFMSFITLKFLALPSLLYKVSDNMSWLVVLILMSIDAVFAFIIIYLIKKSGSKNLYEFMRETIGPVLTKLFLIILSIKYLLVAIHIASGLEFFVVENLYSDFNWILYILPLIILMSFMVYKGLRNISRVFELFFWPIVVGLLYIAITALPGVEMITFLPFFQNGVMPIIKSSFVHTSWFGSSSFLLVLFGNVDFKNEKKVKMVLYIISSVLLVELLVVVFYGLFGITSPTHNFCLSDISQYLSTESAINELSWLVVSLWIVAQAVQISLYGFCFCKTLQYLFKIKSIIIPIVILDVIIFCWGYLAKATINLEDLFFSIPASILTIFAETVIPIVLLIGYALKNKKHKRKAKNEKT